MTANESDSAIIRTPDQRLRVFISSTLRELADERAAAKAAVSQLRLSPVMFELGARAHPPRALYRSYLEQSHIFVGIYWQSYGWVAPGEEISGLEDEYRLSGNRPKLIYIKAPFPEREPRLKELLQRIQADDRAAYNHFSSAAELQELIANDLALLLTEQFEASHQMAESTSAVALEATDAKLPPLAMPSTSLIGRESAVDEICALLRRHDVRLLTLLGPGGIGKTRLSLQVGFKMQAEFKDGVCMVDLASVRSSDLIAPQLAQALGLRNVGLASPQAGQTVSARLKMHLRDRNLLLILDNFEQVLPAAALIADILAVAPHISVLCTSRALLHLRGEHEYEVTPLPLPSTDSGVDSMTRAAVEQNPAVQLFVERAQAIHASFELTDQNAAAIAAICRRLDGLPLALELAAARIRLLTPKAMLAKLTDTAAMHFLTGGARDLPERQQTLRGTIEWSYALLNPHEQRLFRRLAVFGGGSTLEAVEALCSEADTDVLDVLASLIDKSLVRQIAQDTDAGPRFDMLSVIRDYATEQLIASGEREQIMQGHAAFFQAMVVAHAPKLRCSQQASALVALEAELGNVRIALRYLIDTKHWQPACEMAALPWLFWLINAHLAEGLRWMNEIVEHLDTGAPDPNIMQLHALLLGPLGGLLVWAGDYKRAQLILEKARDLYRAINVRGGLASTLVALSICAINCSDWVLAEQQSSEALALNRAINDAWGVAVSLNVSGWLATRQGHYAQSERIYQESLDRSRQLGDKLNESFAWVDLGWAHLLQRHFEQAQTMFKTCLDLSRDLNYKTGIAYAAEGLACVDIEAGKTERGVTLFGAAQALRAQAGAPPWRLDRPVHERLLANARALLGDAIFEAHFNAGHVMSITDALAVS